MIPEQWLQVGVEVFDVAFQRVVTAPILGGAEMRPGMGGALQAALRGDDGVAQIGRRSLEGGLGGLELRFIGDPALLLAQEIALALGELTALGPAQLAELMLADDGAAFDKAARAMTASGGKRDTALPRLLRQQTNAPENPALVWREIARFTRWARSPSPACHLAKRRLECGL